MRLSTEKGGILGENAQKPFKFWFYGGGVGDGYPQFEKCESGQPLFVHIYQQTCVRRGVFMLFCGKNSGAFDNMRQNRIIGIYGKCG